MHAKQATHSFLTSKHILGSNMNTLRMTSSLIDDSMEQLRQVSSSICSIFSNSLNISTSHAKDRSNLIIKDFPLQRSLLSNLTKNLNSFVKAHLPGRKRLSVAIGLARFVDDQSSYKSFAQPLIQAIIKLFNHLEYQSNIEMTLLHFISFQNSYIRTCDKVLETHRLLSFGPRFSSISFSHLIPATVFLPLINDLNFDFSRNMSIFRKHRFLQRLINNARFKVSAGEKESEGGCLSAQDESCSCTVRNVTLSIPRILAEQKCLRSIKGKKNKFKDNDGFYYLSDANQMITLSKREFKIKDGTFRSFFLRILNPPLIRIDDNIPALLTSEDSVYFPNMLNDTFFLSCANTKTNSSLKLNGPGLIRIHSGCNYTSSEKTILIINSNANTILNIKNEQNAFKNFSFQIYTSKLPMDIFNQIEKKFENALAGEDQLQMEIKSLEAQGWLQKWVNRLIEYVLPSASILVLIIAVPIVIYISCQCLPSCKGKQYCCRSNRINIVDENDIRTRVEKLEIFFSYFITTSYHELKPADILALKKMQKCVVDPIPET